MPDATGLSIEKYYEFESYAQWAPGGAVWLCESPDSLMVELYLTDR
jgi:hypothetical protein